MLVERLSAEALEALLRRVEEHLGSRCRWTMRGRR